MQPPGSNAFDGKFTRVTARRQIDEPRVVVEYIYPVGRNFSKLFKREIVVKHTPRIIQSPVFGATVLEVRANADFRELRLA